MVQDDFPMIADKIVAREEFVVVVALADPDSYEVAWLVVAEEVPHSEHLLEKLVDLRVLVDSEPNSDLAEHSEHQVVVPSKQEEAGFEDPGRQVVALAASGECFARVMVVGSVDSFVVAICEEAK